MAKSVDLSQGKKARVDARDFNRVNRYRWSATHVGKFWYATRSFTVDGRKTTQLLHRFILNIPTEVEVEFLDRDGLNCVRSNLRLVTRAQHNWTRRKKQGTTSRFIGVCWVTEKQEWKAEIRTYGIHIHLGYYDDEIEAAQARDAAARKYHGRHARLNFPTSD